jgi:tetratricopeptide (TPR) repeat protein
MKLFLWLIAAIVLSGCVSPLPAPRPATEEAAITWDRRGQDAFRRGEWREALAAHEQALRLYASVENADGVGVELLNVATAQLRLGDRAAARATLERLFDDSGLAIPQRYRADAAYRRAFLEFEAGDNVSADRWIDRATALCAPCDVAGRLSNLKARVALSRDALGAAEAEARRGLDLNRSDAAERANSLRLLAQTHARRREAPQSYVLFEQALALDKDLGDSYKIGLDLMGMGDSLLAQGRKEEAAVVYRRATDVARNGGDAVLARQAEEGLARARTK